MQTYIASSDDSTDAGIYHGEFDTSSGTLSVRGEVTALSQCQYLALHPSNQFLYATGPIENGQVHAFAIDQQTGALEYLNSQPTDGTSPCYVSVDKSGQFVLVVNYTGADDRGSVAVFPVGDDGIVQPKSDFLQYEGSSLHPNRQTSSHPHMIQPDPSGQLVVVSDLGRDKVMLHTLDSSTGKLGSHAIAHIDVPAGAGPRHFTFHPTQNILYVINELNSTLMTYRLDTEAAEWTLLSTLPTLPENYEVETPPVHFDPQTSSVHQEATENTVPTVINHSADVHIHPGGRFLYGSNRGHNSIAIYALHEGSGQPKLIGHQSTLGEWPRSFAIDPTGEFMLVGNLWSNQVLVFHIDAQTGMLTATGQSIDIAKPISIQFLPES